MVWHSANRCYMDECTVRTGTGIMGFCEECFQQLAMKVQQVRNALKIS